MVKQKEKGRKSMKITDLESFINAVYKRSKFQRVVNFSPLNENSMERNSTYQIAVFKNRRSKPKSTEQ